MTVTPTYDATNARVQIAATGLAAAAVALVQRSTDQVLWTTVRGAAAVTVTAGTMTTIYDYEFAPGVLNYYRVRGVVNTSPSYVAAGSASSGSAGSRTPGAPAGIVAGDLVVIEASTRNSGTGTVNTPTSWTQLAASGNLALLGRIYDGAWSIPAVTYAGGAANEDTLAQAVAFRGVDLTPAVSPATLLNISAQNIAYPASVVPDDMSTVLIAGWKQDDYTSVATLAGGVEAAELSSTAGNDASQVLDYVLQSTAADIGAGSFVVTGGASAISRGIVLVLHRQPYLNEQTATITPALTDVWVKSVTRPFLNRAVTVVASGDPVRTPRGMSFPIVNASNDIAITDLARSPTWPLALRAADAAEAAGLDYLVASGDVLYVHVPAGTRIPGGYVRVDQDSPEIRSGSALPRRIRVLPLRQVAAPGPDVVAATSSWATVLSTYGSWAAVLLAHPTWADLLALVAAPSEVIV